MAGVGAGAADLERAVPASDWNMVLLRHDVPDGTWHFDWMLDLGTELGASGGPAPGLVTFRVWQRPDAVGVGESIRAMPLKAHRREYLTFEGEISGGRGRVTRVLVGRARLISEAPQLLEFEAAFVGDGGGGRRHEGAAIGRWSVPRPPDGAAVVEMTRFS